MEEAQMTSIIGFIMWSMAMVIVGYAIREWRT